MTPSTITTRDHPVRSRLRLRALATCFGVGAFAAIGFLISWKLALTHAAGAGAGLALAWLLWRSAADVSGRAAPASPAQSGDADPDGATSHQELLERVNLAARAAGVRVFDWDLVNNRLAIDQATERFSDTGEQGANNPAEFIRRMVHPEDLESFLSGMRDALRHKPQVFLSYRAIQADGVMRPVQLTGQIFRGEDGRASRVLGVTVDMTRQFEASAKIEEQAREYRQALERLDMVTEFAGIGIWDWDLATGKLTTDTHMAKVFEHDKNAFPSADRFIQEVIHPDDVEGFRLAMRAGMKSGNFVQHSYRTREPDGSEHYAQLHSKIFRDETGKPVRMLTVTVETTKLVKATKELEERNAQERALLRRLNLANSTAGIGVWDWEVETDRYTADPSISRAFGVELVDASGGREYFSRIVHPEDRAAFDKVTDDALAAGDSMSHRYRVMLADGEVRHVQTHAHVDRNSDGAAVRFCGISMDVTAEVARANDVQKLLDRLSVACEAAGISPWEYDLQTHQFLWIDNHTRSLGLDDVPVAEYGNALEQLIHPEDRMAMRLVADGALTTDQRTYSYRFRVQCPDGGTRHMQSYAHIVRDDAGVPVRLLGATSDVTKEVETHALLQRQTEQERALIARLNIATESAGISSWEIDLAKGKFLWVENAILGLDETDRDTTLQTFNQRIHPEDRGRFPEALRHAFKNKLDNISYSYRAFHIDGAQRHIRTCGRLLADDNGRVVRVLGVSWDITREVEAAERLEEQARHERMLLDRLSMATEAAGISSWEVDLDTRKFIWSENPIKALHGEKTAIEGTTASFMQAVHPEDRGVMDEAIRQTLKAKQDRFSCLYRGIAADGKIVHIRTHARLMFDDTGWARRILGVSWDITKEIEAAERLQRQAQQLRDAERRLERASLSSSEGHWEADLQTQRVWLSSSYHVLLGYQDGDLPHDMDLFEFLVHPDDFAAGRKVMFQHLKNGSAPFVVDQRFRTQSGEYRWFRQRGTAERDANGRATTLSGSIHDIHQQKLAEDALNLAQRRFERAIHGTQDGLWELESDGTSWCSPRVGELLGYQPNELPAETNLLRRFLHPDDAQTVAIATQAHFQQSLPYDVEIRLQTKTGDYRWYRARATADRDATGRPLRLSGSLQDVTEARAAREQLMRATEAAEAASQAKSAFLANVSHEIRTPMNGIIGMTGLLLDTALDRTQRDYADTIRASADSLLTVINDILDFSKIEAGKLDIEMIDVDLRGNVEDVGSMMAFQAAAKNLELVVHVHPDIPDRVIGDPQRIRQCLINLVGNAIKFTRAGEIVIEVRALERRDGKVLTHFEVRDTGIGIAPDTLKTLFQPFVQADSSTTRHFGGTGLGLSIVRRLVEMMGGKVGVESTVGSGSCFWFTLELQPVAQAALSDTADLTRLGRRVLVVDDNDTNRRVLAGQLTHAGYDVSLAGSGQDALDQLRLGLAESRPYEIVLADYQMPDMDGAALGERINSDQHLSRARVVVLTSLDRHGDIRRFASLGFAGYLTKPVRARELFDCLGRVLAREAHEWHLQSQPIVTRGTLLAKDTTRRHDANVLLVEDNPVNQKVAVRFLERMGCRVRVADNGAEGVKAYGDDRYDIILMDLQMPVMDGLTATRQIRELEGAGHHTPIFALTANAMTGQLERCLEAGMDGFLTKPLQIERLRETLDRYRPAAAPEAAGAPAVEGSQATPVDLGRLNELTDNDSEFAYELACTFIASGDQVLQEIHAALAAADRGLLSRAAHKLKGASANIHAEPLRDLAHSLEANAANLDQPRLKELVGQLTQEFNRASEFLRKQTPLPPAKVS